MAKGNTALTAYKAGERSTRGKKHRRGHPSISLAMVAGLAPTLAFAYDGFKAGGIEEATYRVTGRLTGYNWKTHQWYAGELFRGVGPLVLGAIVHKVANRSGINRSVRQLTMGWLSI